jgi:hypothetical protein
MDTWTAEWLATQRRLFFYSAKNSFFADEEVELLRAKGRSAVLYSA